MRSRAARGWHATGCLLGVEVAPAAGHMSGWTLSSHQRKSSARALAVDTTTWQAQAGSMEQRWSFRHFRDEIRIVPRRAASRLERASAEEPGSAARLVMLVLKECFRSEHERSAFLEALADVGSFDAGRWSPDALGRRVLERVSVDRELIVVREREGGDGCGSIHPHDDVPQLAPQALERPSQPSLGSRAQRSPATAPPSAPHAPLRRTAKPRADTAAGRPAVSMPSAAAEPAVTAGSRAESAATAPPTPAPSAPPVTAPAAPPPASPAKKPASAPPPTDSAGWGGDSSRWSLDKKLRSMHPELRPKVTAVLEALARRGYQPKVFFAWRSVAVQLAIFEKGHTKVKFSFHNAQHKDGTPNAYAADIIDARYGWSAQAAASGFWKALGEEAHAQQLHWGGDWKSFRDWAHVQLVENSKLAQVRKESGL